MTHPFPAHAYVYRARCNRVIDGDTLDLMIDVGFHLTSTQRIRLLDCWAPEVRGDERAAGLAARAYVQSWIDGRPGEWPLRVQTEKSDVFGRFLGVIWDAANGDCLNDQIVAAGHATETKGGG